MKSERESYLDKEMLKLDFNVLKSRHKISRFALLQMFFSKTFSYDRKKKQIFHYEAKRLLLA